MRKKRSKEEFEKAIQQSHSIAETCRHLGIKPSGGNYQIVHNAIKKYSIDTNHFTGQGWNTGLKFKPLEEKPIDKILVADSSFQ